MQPQSLLTWEWLPPAEIRGWAHPAIFAFVYQLLYWAGLDTRWLVAWSPRLLQSFFAALGDVGIGKLGGSTAQILQVMNWFMAFCSPRTYSSSLECVIFIWSLVCYTRLDSAFRAFMLAALTLLIRPTAAILYIPIAAHHLFVRRRSFMQILPGALFYLFLTLTIDRIGYGHWVFVPWNFFKINSFNGVSSFYGTHPMLWYIYAAIPFMLGPNLIPFVFALLKKSVLVKHSLLASIALFAIAVFSLNPHKEFRFILPLMPIFHIFAAEFIDSIRAREWRNSRLLWPSLAFVNLTFFVFFGLIHQAGPDSVINELASLHPHSVLFLMGCHQTQFASHLHGTGISWLKQLDCSPTNPRPHQADMFQLNPERFVRDYFHSPESHWPSHIVLYDDADVSWKKVAPVLFSLGYTEQSRHSHIPVALLGRERFLVILSRKYTTREVVK